MKTDSLFNKGFWMFQLKQGSVNEDLYNQSILKQ